MKFTLAIPTYNRPDDLRRCLYSVRASSLHPGQVLIVDDGGLSEAYIEQETVMFGALNIPFVYYRKDAAHERRGLSESRNRAVALALHPVCVMLDDDVEVRPDFFKEIMDVWNGTPDSKLIAVGGIIENHRAKTAGERSYNRLFGLASVHEWDVTPSGYQVWNDDVRQRQIGYYAHGGVCAYRTTFARELTFEPFSGGRTALEDVDFFLRAKQQGYHVIIEPNAAVRHAVSPVSRESEQLLGRKETANRIQIFRRHGPRGFLGAVVFSWSTLGWIMRQLLSGHWTRAWGMVQGFPAGLYTTNKNTLYGQ